MTITPPTPNWDSAPNVGICINEEWATFVSGLLAKGEAEEYWDSDQIHGAQGIRAIQEALFGICGGMLMAKRMVVVSHRPASGVAGGAAVLGLNQHTLNDLVGLDLTGFSLAANTLTIPPGSYEFMAWHQYERATVTYFGRPVVRFELPAVDHYGESCYLSVAGVLMNGFVVGSFVTAGQNAVKFFSWVSAASANINTLGQPNTMGQAELYGQIALFLNE